MRIAVVGASGFIGSHLCHDLLSGRELRRDESARGDLPSDVFKEVELRAVAREGSPLDAALETHRRTASLGDPNALAEAFNGCDAVVHAAGIRHRDASHKELGWTHVAGTENVVTACKHVRVSKLIFVSCASVSLHGGSRDAWSEGRTMSVRAFDDHAKSLLEAEGAVIGAGASFTGDGPRVQGVILRPALVWGPGGSTAHNLGTAQDFAREASAHGGLRLFGPGRKLISTTYLGNLAQAVRLALTTDAATGSVLHVLDGELNLASDFYGSLSNSMGLPKPKRALLPLGAQRGLAALARLFGGTTLDAQVLLRAQSHALSGAAARELLGYRPAFSRSEGLAELAAWVSERGGWKTLCDSQ